MKLKIQSFETSKPKDDQNVSEHILFDDKLSMFFNHSGLCCQLSRYIAVDHPIKTVLRAHLAKEYGQLARFSSRTVGAPWVELKMNRQCVTNWSILADFQTLGRC